MTTITRRPPVYAVYVIELNADILARRRFREANPGYTYDPDHPPLYVGHSVRTPEERFEQHRTGTKASRFTRGNAIRFRMDLAKKLVFATRREAELMEERHARILRSKGFAVWQK
jgi:predicted GIY-YIG superfamily endonuclease